MAAPLAPPPDARRASLGLALSLLVALPAAGQFLETDHAPGSAVPRLGDARTQRYRVGLSVTADGGACRGIYATLPVPRDWPEQKVRIVEEDVTPLVKTLRYRELGDVKQLVVEIPELPAGHQARAIVTFELERAAILPPEDTSGLRQPDKPDRSLRNHLGSSAYIEARDPKIVKLAREVTRDLDGW